MILRSIAPQVHVIICMTLLLIYPIVDASLGDRLPDFRQCVSVNKAQNFDLRHPDADQGRLASMKIANMESLPFVSDFNDVVLFS